MNQPVNETAPGVPETTGIFGEQSKLRKRSMVIAGHRTSISLETIFWEALLSIAAARGQSIAGLVAEIDTGRGGINLSSAIRVFVLHIALAGSVAAAPTGKSAVR